MTVDRERFERACRIWLTGMTKDQLPATTTFPGLTIPYAALDLVQAFRELDMAQQREILWLLDLFFEGERGPPAPLPEYPKQVKSFVTVEDRPPLALDQTPTNGKAATLHDGWRCRICGKGIAETRMVEYKGVPSTERPCRSCKRLLEIHVYGPLRQRYPRIRRDADPEVKALWESARGYGIEHVRNWTRKREVHVDGIHVGRCPVCTMEPTLHPNERLR